LAEFVFPKGRDLSRPVFPCAGDGIGPMIKDSAKNDFVLKLFVAVIVRTGAPPFGFFSRMSRIYTKEAVVYEKKRFAPWTKDANCNCVFLGCAAFSLYPAGRFGRRERRITQT
jgi:hypothetical protein